VPLSKTDAHPLELHQREHDLGDGHNDRQPQPTIRHPSETARRSSDGTASVSSTFSSFRWSNSDGDGDRHVRRGNTSTKATKAMPRRRSLDAQNVADLKVQLAESQAAADTTSALVTELTADRARLQADAEEASAAYEQAWENCAQLECDLSRQAARHRDVVARLEARLEAQAAELDQIRKERDELRLLQARTVLSRDTKEEEEEEESAVTESTCSSSASFRPSTNRRNSLQRMHNRHSRRLSLQLPRRGSDGGTAAGIMGDRWSLSSELGGQDCTSSILSSQRTRTSRRPSLTESIGASLRDLMSNARGEAMADGSHESLAPEDLLWLSAEEA